MVSNVYAAKVDPAQIVVKAGDDAAQAQWFCLDYKNGEFTLTNGDIRLTGDADKSDLAFDHNRILIKTIEKFSK